MQLISHYMAKANPLQAPDDWLKPEFAALDALPADEFLRRQGASKEALRLADALSPAHTLSDMSTPDVLHKDYAFRWYSKQGPYHHVAKGTAALCTIPTSTLARVEVDAPVPGAQRASWSHLAYAKATIVYLRAKEAFWERDVCRRPPGATLRPSTPCWSVRCPMAAE